MCEYATRYVKHLMGSLAPPCCVDGDNPEFIQFLPYECDCGVLLTELNWVLNQDSNRGTVLYLEYLMNFTTVGWLNDISFPCFGVFTDRLDHCVVIFSVNLRFKPYWQEWDVYYWDPVGKGYLEITTLNSGGFASRNIHIWSIAN